MLWLEFFVELKCKMKIGIFVGRKLITHANTWNVRKIHQYEIQTEILLFGVFKMSSWNFFKVMDRLSFTVLTK